MPEQNPKGNPPPDGEKAGASQHKGAQVNAEPPNKPAQSEAQKRQLAQARNNKPGEKAGAKAPAQKIQPTASKARLQMRHFGIMFSFILFVLVPSGVSAFYLWVYAANQYASYLGFSVRSETAASPSELLGGLSSLAGMSSDSTTDTDILYKFIQSHDLVAKVDEQLDLETIWSKPENDPAFAYTGDGTLEDLLDEWNRKVRIYYDNGMIDLQVRAFDPEDARNISQAIYNESSRLVNELNDTAREDALRYARKDLEDSLARLKLARQAVTEFRNRYQMVDPTADVQSQVGVLTELQQQLAEALVQLGLLRANAQSSDPRIEQSELRISIIREQIAAERQKFGSETATGEALSDVVGQYESLAVDREFAESTYTASLAAFDAAKAEASRQTRYLAAYVKPTLAQQPEYPERAKLLAILSGFLMIIWIIAVLVFYSLRDRR